MITQDRLKELLHYNPDTGIFTRIKTIAPRAKSGDVAGWSYIGYIRIGIDGKYYLAHRLAHLYVKGKFPFQADHADHDRSNNRWDNICRDVSHQENHKNIPMLRSNTSGFTGVGFAKASRKWIAEMVVNGERKWLGSFANKSEAIEARKAANIKYGFHKNHGLRAAKNV